jgi:hypothetical protein
VYRNNWNEPLANAVAFELGYGPYGFTGMVAAPHIPWVADILDANDIAKGLGKLREKLYGSDFNMSVFLGEGHQTLGLIADTAKRIGRSLRAVRRGDLRLASRFLLDGTSREGLQNLKRGSATKGLNRKKAASSMGNDWLELQYGWLPLLEDTYGAAQSLAHTLKAPAMLKVSASRQRMTTVTMQLGANGPYRDARYWFTKSNSSRRRWTVWFKERPALSYQLGLMDPQLVAWELVPWSFVIDWFIPIGQYLDARASVSSIKADLWVVSSKDEGFTPGKSVTGALLQGSAHFRDGRFVRTVSTQPPEIPFPRFKPLSQVASWQHAANAIALLVTSPKTGRRTI